MACELIEKILAIESALVALRDKCAQSFTLPESRECAVPYLLTMIQAATAIRDGGYGVTESVSRPDVPACVTGSFLDGVLAWVQGMDCGGSLYAYQQVLWFFSWLEGFYFDAYSFTVTSDGILTPTQTLGSLAVVSQVFWTDSPRERSVFLPQTGPHSAIITALAGEGAGEWQPEVYSPENSRWLMNLYRFRYAPNNNAIPWDDWEYDPTWNSNMWWVSGIEDTDDPIENFTVIGSRTQQGLSDRWDFEFPEGYIIQ